MADDSPKGQSLRDFLSERSQKNQAPQSTPQAATPPKPESEGPTNRVQAPAAKKPHWSRGLLGAWADEAFRDTGHIGNKITEGIRGKTTHSSAVKASSSVNDASDPDLSKAGAVPSTPPIGTARKLSDVEKQVIQVDQEVRAWNSYFLNEVKNLREDVKSVSDTATRALRTAILVRKDAEEAKFKKKVASAVVRGKDGRFMSADSAMKDPSRVHDSDSNFIKTLLDDLEKLGIGAGGAGGAWTVKGLIDRLRGKGRGATDAVEAPKLSKLAETPIEAPKGAAEGLLGRLKGAGRGGLANGLKGGVVGWAIQSAGEYGLDKVFGTPDENYAADVKKYGKEKADELYYVRSNGALSRLYDRVVGNKPHGPEGDASPAPAPAKGDQSEDDAVISSKKDVSLSAIQDVRIEARNELKITGRTFKVDVERLEFLNAKMEVVGLKLAGGSTPKRNAIVNDPGLQTAQTVYDQNVQKYGKDKADALLAAGDRPYSVGGVADRIGNLASGHGWRSTASRVQRGDGKEEEASTGIPSKFVGDITAMTLAGAKPHNIRAYMESHGIDLSEATCGQFMASIVREHGGQPPKNPAVASNWNNFGGVEGAGYSDDPNAINVAVKQGVGTGGTGSHVTSAIPIRDKDGNITGFRGVGVNQFNPNGPEHGVGQYGRDVISSMNLKIGTHYGEYQIRHQIVTPKEDVVGQSTAGSGDLDKASYDKMFDGTPLAGQYDNVVKSAAKNGVPASVMASIMAQETGRGKSAMLRDRNNPAGLMDPKTGSSTGMTFSSIEEGIERAGLSIGKNYKRAGGDIDKMATTYTPVGAANDRGQNASWPSNVKKFMSTMTAPSQQKLPPPVTASLSPFSDAVLDEKDAAWFSARKEAKAVLGNQSKTDATPVQAKPDRVDESQGYDPATGMPYPTQGQQSDADQSREAKPTPPPEPEQGYDPATGMAYPTTPPPAQTDDAGSKVAKAPDLKATSAHEITAPVNHPEREGPRPGSDGYGDKQHDPDDCGLCAV